MEEGGDSFYVLGNQHNTGSIDYKIGDYKVGFGCDAFFKHEEYLGIQHAPKQIPDNNSKTLKCGFEAGIWITLACILVYYSRYHFLKRKKKISKLRKIYK